MNQAGATDGTAASAVDVVDFTKLDLEAMASMAFDVGAVVDDQLLASKASTGSGLYMAIAVVDESEPGGYYLLGDREVDPADWPRPYKEEAARLIATCVAYAEDSDQARALADPNDTDSHFEPGGVWHQVTVEAGEEQYALHFVAVTVGHDQPVHNKTVAASAGQAFAGFWMTQQLAEIEHVPAG